MALGPRLLEAHQAARFSNAIRKAISDLARCPINEMARAQLTAGGNILQSALGMPTWSVALGVTAMGSALTGVIDEIVTVFRQRNDISAGPGKALITPYKFALRG